jgi:hypothetical protein
LAKGTRLCSIADKRADEIGVNKQGSSKRPARLTLAFFADASIVNESAGKSKK